MKIASTNEPHKVISTEYSLERRQHANETTAYFVLEHAPETCDAYPPSGVCTFQDIAMEVDGKPATPEWKSVQGASYMCKSKATIVDSKTIKFTWDATDTAGIKDNAANSTASVRFPSKWGWGTTSEN